MRPELPTTAQAREREVFLGALEKADEAQRAAFLAAACGSDQALRARVEALLHSRDGLGSFLETPALEGGRDPLPRAVPGPTDTEVVSFLTENAGDRIGRYKLLQKIGEGGVGVVYMAEQEEPVRRRVALKIIKLGMDTKNVIARFEAERQALAMMDHPNIAKVLDGGATATGRPYFVMELVRGVRLTEFCSENNLPTEERLKLFIQVCQAIQHAHQKGVIHRDIKPSNILVTLHDDKPVPKVIDFGIAKAIEQRLTEKTLFTEYAMFIGTPAYMSPEQAQMSGLDIDTRSDIYALGVLLYELLTGKTPFDPETLMHAGLDECRRTIREEEPLRPSARLATMVKAELTTTAQQRRLEAPRLIHLLSGDLDWIAMKCLEKDRAHRYESAGGLAMDVQCYLDGEPVLARPPSRLYRFRKFARRNQSAFAFAAAMALTLLAGITMSVWQAVRATRAEHQALNAQQYEVRLREQAEGERSRAEQKESLARLNEYVADINLAKQSLDAGNYGRAVQLLEKHRPLPNQQDLRGFEWRYLWQVSRGDEHVALPGLESPVQSLAFSPDHQWLVVGSMDRFNVYHAGTKALVATVPKAATTLAFLPDGKTLLTAGPGEREPRRPLRGPGGPGLPVVRAWNTADWTEQPGVPRLRLYGPIALSRDGTTLATTLRGMRGGESAPGVRLWDVSNPTNWNELRTLVNASAPMAFAPDGRSLVTDSKAGLVVWPLEQGRPEIFLQHATNLFASGRSGGPFRPAGAVTFSPDGHWVIATRNTLSEHGVFVLGIWNLASGDESAMPDDPDHNQHTGVISSLAFSPDRRLLATASMDYSIRLWDFTSRQRVAMFQGHLSEVWTLAFSPDGQSLVSGAKDGSVKIWPVNHPPTEELLEGTWQPPLAISKDSRTLGVVRQGTVTLIDLNSLEREWELPAPGISERARFRLGQTMALNENLTALAQNLEDGMLRLWNLETRESTTFKVSDRPVSLLALAPDGYSLITGGFGHALRWWNLREGTNAVLETEAMRVLFSPRNDMLAVFQQDNTVELWDAATRTRRMRFESETDLQSEAADFSPDSRILAIACADDAVRLWDTATGMVQGICAGHKQAVSSVAFAPDGKTLASASDDSTLKLWHVATQQELLTLRRLSGALRTLLFSPDGRVLVGRRSSMLPFAGLRFFRAPSFEETDLEH